MAADVLDRDTYMDDLGSSTTSIEAAVQIADQLIALCKAGGFELVKWTSNSPELLSHIPESHRHAESISLDDTNTLKILGLRWLPGESSFSEDIKNVYKGKRCSTKIQKLLPFISNDNGLLLVGGRLKNSSLEYSQKHPVLLPKSGHIIDILIDFYHNQHLHAGPQLLLGILRSKYWILSARNAVRKRINKCVNCFKVNPKPTYPYMGDLPSARLEKSKAFLHTGIDYAGPFYITMSRKRGAQSQKAYLCIFICLVTKAIHLELASDLSSASFLDALKRFLSKRGTCECLYSDNGRNFVSSKTYLKELNEFLATDEYYKTFNSELSKNRISWQLNPPNAAHFGGLWESNIKSVKKLLFRVIGKQILTYEELFTVFSQIEGVLNSRPLFWELEEVPSSPIQRPDDVECEQIYCSTTERDPVSGRYVVALPFREDVYTLGDSEAIARKRFLCLERKLEASPNLRAAYDAAINDYINKQYLLPAPAGDLASPSYIIPHHGVVREDKPLRPVLDASCKTSTNVSLNDILHSGPNLQGDLFQIILNFRLHVVAMSADCRQMFLQIVVRDSDRRFQKIFYRFNPQDPLILYEFSRVCFGIKSSPFHALRTVRQLITDQGDKYPLARDIASRSLYMDDLAFSSPNNDSAVATCKQLIDMFKEAQWDLVKWNSNSHVILDSIPDTHKLYNAVEFDKHASFKILDRSLWPLNNADSLHSVSEIPEQKVIVNIAAAPAIKSIFYELALRNSSWSKYLRIVVYILRFAKLLPRRPSSSVTNADLNFAEHRTIMILQHMYFLDEILKLKNNQPCSLAFNRLRPFMENDVIRVGGRLSNSVLDYTQKHPIVLPRRDHIVNLIVDYYHRTHLHAGPELLMSLLRQRYWIMSARRIIRQRIHKCNICFRSNPRPTLPLMADLPDFRARPVAKPFTHTGCDYAGPIAYTPVRRRGSRAEKAYICVFTCLTTRAVQIELVTDLSTPTFLAAFKRFLSRRGPVRCMYSDNGTNFMGANSYLKDLYQFLAKHASHFENFFSENRVEWRFNPPSASHFGGCWESMVKTIKNHLFKVIGKQLLSYEELYTVLTQVEGLLNSRPLTTLSSDPSEPSALTPNHFLNNFPLSSLPAPECRFNSRAGGTFNDLLAPAHLNVNRPVLDYHYLNPSAGLLALLAGKTFQAEKTL
ncbi:hypothetical protein ACJJTC_007108 [Scirpophaga incertulas]